MTNSYSTGGAEQQQLELSTKLLDAERKFHPNEVTEREIELVKRVYQHSILIFDPYAIYSPTINKNPSQDQLTALIELDPGLPSYALHSLQNTPKDRDIAKNIIKAAQKSEEYFNYCKGFMEKDEGYDNSLVGDPELTTLMVAGLNNWLSNYLKKNADKVNIDPVKNYLIAAAPVCAKHSQGKKICMDMADTIHKKEEDIFKQNQEREEREFRAKQKEEKTIFEKQQDSYLQDLNRMFPNVSVSQQKDITG